MEKALYSPFMDRVLKAMLRLVGLDATRIRTCLKPVSPLESIKNVTVPIFIIGCSNDSTIPVAVFEKAYENANSTKKELWIVDGDAHVDTFSHRPEEYIQKVRSFTNTILQ